MSGNEITVRPERPEDFEAIDDIVTAAFLAEFGTTSEAGLIRTDAATRGARRRSDPGRGS